MFDASEYWITVVELPTYEESIEHLLTPEETEGVIAFLARHPDEGAVLPNTGGVRKLKWGGARGSAKRGAQVIYYFRDLNMPLYLLAAIPCGERIRLTRAQEAEMRQITEAIVNSQWDNQVAPLVQGALRPTN